MRPLEFLIYERNAIILIGVIAISITLIIQLKPKEITNQSQEITLRNQIESLEKTKITIHESDFNAYKNVSEIMDSVANVEIPVFQDSSKTYYEHLKNKKNFLVSKKDSNEKKIKILYEILDSINPKYSASFRMEIDKELAKSKSDLLNILENNKAEIENKIENKLLLKKILQISIIALFPIRWLIIVLSGRKITFFPPKK